MLPTPVKVTSPSAGRTSAIATAAPRVVAQRRVRRLATMSAAGVGGVLPEDAHGLARRRAAASGPWPRPSATSTDHPSPVRRPGPGVAADRLAVLGDGDPGHRRRPAAGPSASARSRASTAVPAPGAEKISHRSAIRSHGAQAAPLVPPVE